MWNCSEIDVAFTEVHQIVRTGDVAISVTHSVLLLLGGALLVAGEQLSKPVGAIVGGIGGFVATILPTRMFGVT